VDESLIGEAKLARFAATLAIVRGHDTRKRGALLLVLPRERTVEVT